MKISCIIVEDEPLALERTKAYVAKLPYLTLAATFTSAIDALTFLKTRKIDLIFLDIDLGEFSGIQMLETTAVASQVIMTTAHQDYALKAFDLKVADYLLKPFTLERFIQAVERVQANLAKKQPATPRSYIFVKVGNRLEKLMLREILYIEGMRDYRRIHTVKKSVMTLETFSAFERQIPSQVLCRVHKSYMVSVDKIDSIEKDLIFIAGQEIPISETYKERFLAIISRVVRP